MLQAATGIAKTRDLIVVSKSLAPSAPLAASAISPDGAVLATPDVISWKDRPLPASGRERRVRFRSYTYDAAGRRTAMTDSTGSTSWSYDAAAQVTSVTAPQGTVGYGYNPDGSRLALILPGNQTVAYGYDAAGRLTSVTDPQSRTVSFGYDVDSHRTSITRPNGVTSALSYDSAGRLTGITHTGPGSTTLQSFNYTLDAAGNRTAVTTPTGSESYTIDPLGRITKATYANGDSTSYTYDADGNRLTRTSNGTVTTYSYNDADELLSDGTITCGYDVAGNLTSAGTNCYSWDRA